MGHHAPAGAHGGQIAGSPGAGCVGPGGVLGPQPGATSAKPPLLPVLSTLCPGDNTWSLAAAYLAPAMT